MAVVKANAYGHGLPQVARALVSEAQMFGVANLAEARATRAALREAGEGCGHPVFILGAALPSERAAIVREGFIAAVSSVEEAAAYATHGTTRVHLAIDTGMGRMGAWESDAIATARAIHLIENIHLEGICTHLPVADEDDTYTADQVARFQRLAIEIRETVSSALLVHMTNSAGAIGFPAATGDLIRGGLALYGVSPRPEFQGQLRPALTWKTRVILVRNFAQGAGVSYGRTFICDRPMRVATLAAGYADGYQRQVSGRGAHVLIRGHRCPVLGRVTMDQIMVDVTDLPEVAPGEEAVLIGARGGEEVTASQFARWAGTIPWHVFTSLGPRVARVHTDESASFQTGIPQ